MDNAFIKKLPQNLFLNLSEELLPALMSGKNIGIYGIPGYGMNILADQIEDVLQKQPKIICQRYNSQTDTKFPKVRSNSLQKNGNKVHNSKKHVLILNQVRNPRRKFFKNDFKELRKTFPSNTSILVIGNHSLLYQREEYSANNLYTHLLKNQPFNLRNVQRIVRIFNEQYNWKISEKLAKEIFFLTGGNYNLLKSVCQIAHEYSEEIISNQKALLSIYPLKYHISRIANILPQLDLDQLLEIGIIHHNGTIFSPLVAKFLKKFELPYISNLFPNLTETDRKVLSIFVQNSNTIISKDHIALFLDQSAGIASKWGIYKAVERMKDKIKDNPNISIKTVKGQGWKMEKAEI